MIAVCLLFVNSAQNLLTTIDRRLLKSSTGPQLTHPAGTFKFLLIPFQSVYYRIGRAYYRKGNYAKAVDTLVHAFNLAEDNPSLIDYRMYDTYGGALFALNRFEEAANAYNHALTLIPVDHEHGEKIRHYQKLALEKANAAL